MRNINKPNRYNVASIQAQQTLGGDVMQADENGQYVEWRDYAWLLSEVERLTNCKSEADRLKSEVDRLRKTWDAMAEIDACFDGKTPIMSGMESIFKIVKRWKKL